MTLRKAKKKGNVGLFLSLYGDSILIPLPDII
jgi:hypothetical protein